MRRGNRNTNKTIDNVILEKTLEFSEIPSARRKDNLVHLGLRYVLTMIENEGIKNRVVFIC